MSRDLRDYARRTNVRLAAGAFLLLFIVGLGLIYLFYGKAAAGFGFLCLLAGLLPIGLILLVFVLLERIMKSVGRK
jgi:hypothetical protein